MGKTNQSTKPNDRMKRGPLDLTRDRDRSLRNRQNKGLRLNLWWPLTWGTERLSGFTLRVRGSYPSSITTSLAYYWLQEEPSTQSHPFKKELSAFRMPVLSGSEIPLHTLLLYWAISHFLNGCKLITSTRLKPALHSRDYYWWRNLTW